MIACLHWSPGSALSHEAAAVLGGVLGAARTPVVITVPRGRERARSDRVIVHWTKVPIPPEDITTIDGIPVTTPARTLIDLATVESEHVIERCLDDMLRRRLVSLPFLEKWLDDPARKGHRGLPLVRRLVAARATVGLTESPLETDVLRLLRNAGLPIPMVQYEIKDDRGVIARLDFAYPDEKVAIEADGFRYHDRRGGFDRERARGNEIESMGWAVLRITAAHIARDPNGVVRWVQRALANGRRQ